MSETTDGDLAERMNKALGDLPRVDATEEEKAQLSLESTTAAIEKYNPPPEAPKLELTVYDSDASGRPTQKNTATLQGIHSIDDLDVISRAMLAKADPTSKWSEFTLPTIVNAILFAEQLGLSFEEGDVYTTAKANSRGVLSLTAKARIKRGSDTRPLTAPPRFVFEELPDLIKFRYVEWNNGRATAMDGETKNVKLTVFLSVEGWAEPFEYETDLAEWFDGTKETWRKRPRYMLRQNAFGHAFELISNGPTTEEEIAIVDQSSTAVSVHN